MRDQDMEGDFRFVREMSPKVCQTQKIILDKLVLFMQHEYLQMCNTIIPWQIKINSDIQHSCFASL